ncbi:hypothetical protein GN244_ATG19069 [Phytophthora infestans]|uniref:Uncharacterized protein n=1 Tax=Phytophthora infestans TaxID=4787 RepID=A0A833WD74_PHYIN|nr:hypothetical protein GN244_ATG19069 [Phytophthora infestans]
MTYTCYEPNAIMCYTARPEPTILSRSESSATQTPLIPTSPHVVEDEAPASRFCLLAHRLYLKLVQQLLLSPRQHHSCAETSTLIFKLLIRGYGFGQ